jgi:hypothetical protein
MHDTLQGVDPPTGGPMARLRTVIAGGSALVTFMIIVN